MSNPQARLFFITGVSSGFGDALARAALAAGHSVVGTLRNEAARAAFDELSPGRSFGKLLDITNTAAIAPVVADVEARIGPIDVLVNNAGYGHEGVLEESTIDDLRRQFEVNVFGPAALMQAVLPYMRTRRAGRILNITSMGGLTTFPGISFYNGSKFALEGLSSSVGKEVREFGIRVTAVEPGMFRTDWAGRSMTRVERSIPDYDAVFEPIRRRRHANSGKQAGDPAKAAQALLQLVASPDPPTHLLLGKDAVSFVRAGLATLQSEIDSWESVSSATDFDS
jgi:NAD(P)-dependent dehydrogenase (short-subunit alcohol dehydrogenase family)